MQWLTQLTDIPLISYLQMFGAHEILITVAEPIRLSGIPLLLNSLQLFSTREAETKHPCDQKMKKTENSKITNMQKETCTHIHNYIHKSSSKVPRAEPTSTGDKRDVDDAVDVEGFLVPFPL